MKKTLIGLLAIILGLQTLVYCQTDTIYNRYKHYYYTTWYDSCYATGAGCDYLGDLFPGNPCVGTYASSNYIQGVYHHTNTPLEIIGVVGGLIKTEFTDTTRVPEYFMVFDDVDGEWVLVDSARWDTAEIKYMALETQKVFLEHRRDTIDGVVYLVEYYDTIIETKYMKICEAYFKEPIMVSDSFLLGGSSFNNVRPPYGKTPYDCAGFIHEPTEYSTNFYATCDRYSPDWVLYDGNWLRARNGNYNSYYYVMFPIIRMLDTFQIIGTSHNESQGTVEGSGEYIKNSRVALTAIPNEGYKFLMWNDSVTDNPRVFYAEQDTAFTAFFAPVEQYVVSVESSDLLQGTVSGGGTYYENTSVEIVAQPNEGYKFTMWNDSVTDNPRTIVVSQDTLFTAYFEVKIGINEAENNTDLFTISPNPATNNLQINICEAGKYTMEIYSVNGTMVKQEQITQSSTIDVSALVPGNYFIKIYNATTTGIRAFVKQ